MAAITYTLLDAKTAVYALLHGQKFAEGEAGLSLILAAINRAQAEVPALLGSLAFAGGLLTSASYSAAASDVFDMTSTDWLAPLAAEVKDGASTYAQANFATPERILRASRTGIASKEYLYSFMGKNLWVRPIIPTGGSAIVYGLKKPTAMTSDGNALEADPRLFRAICVRAAWIVMQKFPAEDPNRFEQLQKDMIDELNALKGQIMALKAEEYENRTGRDLTFGGNAPGQGG